MVQRFRRAQPSQKAHARARKESEEKKGIAKKIRKWRKERVSFLRVKL